MDRDLLFEKLLDNLELYFNLKRDLNRKVKAAWAEENFDTEAYYWQEYETLDTLRELSRRALDEYIATGPNRERRGEAEEEGS